MLTTYWAPGGEEITLTMKLRRRTIRENTAEIEDLYAPHIGPSVHEPEPTAVAAVD